jgi:heme exporter protein D
MSGAFVSYVWAAYAISLAGLAAMTGAALAAWRRARRAVQDSETKP